VSVSEDDIQNEARVVSDIRDKGGHENIIKILGYGWLKGSLNVYYIDMELADFTLADYIDHYKGTKSSKVDIEALQSLSPVFVHKESPLQERMKNLWSIGTHIARGLEFMHFYEYVHRDLKPCNGTIPRPHMSSPSIDEYSSPLLSRRQSVEAYRFRNFCQCNVQTRPSNPICSRNKKLSSP
jgi:serine/threonine protein kinase